MNKYEHLPPEKKLEVVRRWMEYSINYKCDNIFKCRKTTSCFLDIDRYFQFYCRDMQHGTKQYGLAHAKYCFYCGRRMRPPNTTGGYTDPRQATVDHFFPRGHVRRDKVIFVICCAGCNTWKSNRKPEDLLSMIVTKSKLLPNGWRTSTYRSIKRVLIDSKTDHGPEAYYFEKKVIYNI